MCRARSDGRNRLNRAHCTNEFSSVWRGIAVPRANGRSTAARGIEQRARRVLAGFDASILDAPRRREVSVIERRLLQNPSVAAQVPLLTVGENHDRRGCSYAAPAN
jgi:hypothetical protein